MYNTAIKGVGIATVMLTTVTLRTVGTASDTGSNAKPPVAGEYFQFDVTPLDSVFKLKE